MDFDLTEKQTYWRDRIRDHIERFVRPRVADYKAEDAQGSRWESVAGRRGRKGACQGRWPLELVHAAWLRPSAC